METTSFRSLPNLIKQDGLADATEPDEHHAFGRTAELQPLKPDSDVAQDIRSTGKFRWRAAGAGREWIAYGVHI